MNRLSILLQVVGILSVIGMFVTASLVQNHVLARGNLTLFLIVTSTLLSYGCLLGAMCLVRKGKSK